MLLSMLAFMVGLLSIRFAKQFRSAVCLETRRSGSQKLASSLLSSKLSIRAAAAFECLDKIPDLEFQFPVQDDTCCVHLL